MTASSTWRAFKACLPPAWKSWFILDAIKVLYYRLIDKDARGLPGVPLPTSNEKRKEQNQ
jgi:hypothetical protein